MNDGAAMLDRDEIAAAAAAMAGVDPSAADDAFADNLRVAVDSANEEAALSPAGVEAVREELLFGLANRLQADRWTDDYPRLRRRRSGGPFSSRAFRVQAPPISSICSTTIQRSGCSEHGRPCARRLRRSSPRRSESGG
jgi:hypothetical protein